jgi:hypothetical protein
VVLRDTGHAWQSFLPLLLAPALAALAVGLLRHAVSRRPAPAAWPFAVLPPLAFLLQEQLERLGHDGRLHLALTTPVVAGVLLAMPFGLAAYAAASALLSLSDAAARALAAPPPRLLAAPTLAALTSLPLPAAVPASLRSGRGPPPAR